MIEFVSETDDMAFKKKLQELDKQGFVVTHYQVTAESTSASWMSARVYYTAILEKE